MFTFLNPALLIAAAAALIPLIIHLLSRRRVKVVEFSSIRHLKAMQRQQVRRLKIRQLLLLLLRMLLVFILVLAFARPTTTSGAFGSQAAATSVILFDNSASMNRFVPNGQLFELAKRRTDALLASFSTDDRVAIISLISEGTNPTLVTPALAREQLAAITPGDASGSLQSGMQQAMSVLQSSPSLNRELYLVTDRQRGLIPDSAVADSSALGALRLTILDLPFDQPNNVGVTSVSLGTQLLSVGVPFNVTGKLTNTGNSAVQDLLVSLFIDGRRVAQTTTSIAAGEEGAVTFATSVPSTGLHHGYIEISADQFPGDNRSYFAIRLPEVVSVLIVGDDPGGRLARLALQPAPEATSYWSVKQADANALLSLPLDEYQVILLAGTPVLGAVGRERLDRFIASGRSLLVMVGEATSAEAFAADYADLTGMNLDSPMPEVLTRSGFFLLKSVAAEHPIFSLFQGLLQSTLRGDQLPEIKAYTLPKMSWRQSGTTLMSFSGDRLGMGEYRRGRGKVITIAVPLDPSLSELATTALFVPFMARTIEYLAADLSAYETELRVGTTQRRPLPSFVTAGSRVEVIRPDSTRREVQPEYIAERMSATISGSRQAGIWTVTVDGRVVDHLPLNLDPAESELRVLPVTDFTSALGIAEATTIPAQGEIGPILASLRYGRELWPTLLWFALGLIALELWLGRAAPRDDEAA